MWFVRVLLNLPTFIRLLVQADRYFRDQRPDAVVLIDYPGFNWCDRPACQATRDPGVLLRSAADLGLGRLAGQEGPQVRRPRPVQPPLRAGLVSRPGRAGSRTTSGIPTSTSWPSGSSTRLSWPSSATEGGPVVAILPGSRTQEAPEEPADHARPPRPGCGESRPDVRFVVACLHEKHRALAREILGKSGVRLPIEVHAGRTPELIRLADVAWAVSGSVGLELMVEALPSVVLYKIGPSTSGSPGSSSRRSTSAWSTCWPTPSFMPEYLTSEDVSRQLADWARTLARRPGGTRRGDRGAGRTPRPGRRPRGPRTAPPIGSSRRSSRRATPHGPACLQGAARDPRRRKPQVTGAAIACHNPGRTVDGRAIRSAPVPWPPRLAPMDASHADRPGQSPGRRDQPVPAPARAQPGRLVSLGSRGARPGPGPRTSRSSCRSATRPATGATSWSTRASRTPRSRR